ncbi:MAG: hypothetical protein HYU64_06235 [Armatimonadetes bacterium]|nr:hypothetical protein [Armatimonadota bacterium]
MSSEQGYDAARREVVAPRSGTPQGEIVTLSLPARPEYVSVLRLAMSAIASRISEFTYEDTEDIKLAVSEGFSLLLASRRQPSNVAVECALDARSLRISLRSPRSLLACRNRAPLALQIIEALMDEVAVSDKGRESPQTPSLVMVKHFHKEKT